MDIRTIFAIVLILSALGIGVVYFATDGQLWAVGDIDLPTAPNGAIVHQLFGYAKCEATGQKTQWLGLPLEGTVGDNTKFSYSCDDPQQCDIRFDAVCSDGGQDNLRYALDYQFDLFGNSEQAKGVVLQWSKDEFHTIYLGCVETSWGITSMKPPTASGVQYRKTEYGIYLYTEGYGRQGLFDASLPDCTYISTDTELKKLFDAQPSGTVLPPYGTHLPLGQTDSFTVGWVESPVIGNFNPAGQYNGNDVLCRSSVGSAEIIKLDPVSTIGGKTYYMEGSVLQSGANVCCPGGFECSEGFFCEAYHCTTEPIVCDEGECNQWQRGKTIEQNICDLEDGKYYNYDIFCNQDACIETQGKKQVPCCPGTCGPGKKCDVNDGCVDVNILKECPTGECCNEGGEYNVKSCGAGLECCFELDDAYRGLCKTACEIEPECTTDADCIEMNGEGWTCADSGVCVEGESEQEKCEEKGGNWVVIEEECSWLQKTFQGCKDTTTGVCRIPHTPILAIIFALAGFIMIIAGAIWVEGEAQFPMIFFGAIIFIIDLVWLILAGGGVI